MTKGRSEIINIVGNEYGRLRVVGFSHTENGRSYWICECKCGKTVVLRKDSFAYKYSKQQSCGCLQRERSSARMKERHQKRRVQTS